MQKNLKISNLLGLFGQSPFITNWRIVTKDNYHVIKMIEIKTEHLWPNEKNEEQNKMTERKALMRKWNAWNCLLHFIIVLVYKTEVKEINVR